MQSSNTNFGFGSPMLKLYEAEMPKNKAKKIDDTSFAYGVLVGVGIGIMFQPLVVACGALAIIGFKASGVLAGAITAVAQSSIANVTTGSLFASK